MRYMNEMEIDEALVLVHRSVCAVEFVPYVQYLSDWKDLVNRCSDGWPYWAPAVKAAGKLIVEVERLLEHIQPWRVGPTQTTPRPKVADFKKALTPIKSFATKHKLQAPALQPVQLRLGV